MKHLILAASGLVLAAGCASSTVESGAGTEAALPPPDPAPVVTEQTAAERAIDTANELAAAGNFQAAIDRLTQQVGSPQLTGDERAALYRLRGDIRLNGGDDTWGAIEDFQQAIDLAPGSATALAAEEGLNVARGKATSLNFRLETGGLTRAERLETLWELGDHEDALDMLRQGGVTAEPDTLLAMYQIGYLCEGEAYTGEAFNITEPDGTPRVVYFCDTGK